LQKENSKLQADNALIEAEKLKFQLEPHTLNNLLANLMAISSKLNRGMEALSEILEYIIYKGNAHFVSGEDEVTFIKKYLTAYYYFLSFGLLVGTNIVFLILVGFFWPFSKGFSSLSPNKVGPSTASPLIYNITFSPALVITVTDLLNNPA